VLLAFARDPSRCFNAGDVVKSSGVSPSCVYKNLKALVASGEIVRDGPGVYRWPKIEDAKTAPATPPAPAPVIPPPEQPADVAPAPAPETPLEPVPAAALRPFAGITMVQTKCRGLGRELSILDELEGLDDAARERVLGYAFARWPGKLDIVREVEVRYPTPDSLVTEILDTLDRFARTAL